MLFKRPKTEDKSFRYPGDPRALDGHAAALAMEATAGDLVVVQSAAGLAGPLGNLAPAAGARAARIERAADPAAVAARVTGASATGLRTAAVVDALGGILPSLHATAGKRLTTVYHLTCRTLPRHSGALHGSHDDYYAVSDTGLFQMFARGAQEVADFTLIAHAVAERALTPGICAQDYYRTSQSVRGIRLPEARLVAEYLGRPGDTIECPTPSQRVLFGKERRRVPLTVDPDHPAGIGGIQDAESYLKALSAQRTYFASHLGGIIAGEFARFAELTGRRYAEAQAYRVDDADVVVLAQGAVVDELEAAVDYLREHEGIKAGVIDVAVFRPFPGAALTRLLRGKRVVTVLERTDRPLAATLPMTAEVRAAIDLAMENGAAAEPVHKDYDKYRAGDRPRVLTAVYGAGGELPSFAELVAVFRNMTSDSPKATCYVGLGEDATIRRFPHLHSLQQALNRDYPDRNATALPAAEVEPPRGDGDAVRLYSLSVQGGLFAGNLFAQSLAEDARIGARTFPQGGLETAAHLTTLTITHNETGDATHARPQIVDTVLVAGGKLIEDVSSRDDLTDGGNLIVESGREPESLWTSLSRRAARWIQDKNVRMYQIDAGRIAAETASKPSAIDQLAIWALLGAYAWLRLPVDGADTIVDGLHARLTSIFGESHYLVDDIIGAFRRGGSDLKQVAYAGWGTEDLPAASDGDAPWTVKDAGQWEANVFDAARFWHSVGYLYDSGQSERALADPYLATGIIPAASSAFRDLSPYRLRVPDWMPENCTGCGDCWSLCPDSALPPTIQSVGAMVATSMSQAERAGTTLVQLKRFAEPLVKQAYKLFAADGMHRFLRLGTLLDDAFAQIVDKLGLDDDKRKALQEEFDAVRATAARFQMAKTDTFFEAPHAAEKGSGLVLSIGLNPLACTGCGTCVDVCPEGALGYVPQTPECLEERHDNWEYMMELPDVERSVIERFVTNAATHVHHLFDHDAYHTLVGGDGSFQGNTAKTAVRLVAAAAETVMAPRFAAHVAGLDDLIARLEARIQGDVSSVLKINDFDAFARRLDRIDTDALSPDALSAATGDEQSGVDPSALRRLTHLLDELKEQRRLYMEGNEGHGRARMIMAIDSDAARLWSGTYPYNPLPYPWVCHVPGDGLAVARGVYEGIARSVAAEIAVCRAAALELDDAYDPDTHDARFDAFGVDDLDDDERALIPPVLVIGEAGTTDSGDMAELLAGDEPIRMLLLDSSGLLPDGAAAPLSETGLVAMAQDNPASMVVQASVGHPGHLIHSAAEGFTGAAPALFRVCAPDPNRSGIASDKGAEQARLAVESRAFPLFTVTGGVVSIAANPAPNDEWSVRPITFKEPSGTESTVETPVTPADWAVGEARFQAHFRVVPKGQIGEESVPLAEYVAMSEAEREGREPYVHFAGASQRHLVAVVSTELARAATARRDAWAILRGSATPAPPPEVSVATTAEEPAETPPPAAASDAAVHQALTERLLQLSGFSSDPDFFKQSLREFVVQRNLDEDGATGDDETPGQ